MSENIYEEDRNPRKKSKFVRFILLALAAVPLLIAIRLIYYKTGTEFGLSAKAFCAAYALAVIIGAVFMVYSRALVRTQTRRMMFYYRNAANLQPKRWANYLYKVFGALMYLFGTAGGIVLTLLFTGLIGG